MLFKTLTQIVAATALASQVVAQPLHHLHHQHAKRDVEVDVVVVTETVVVTANVAGNQATTTLDFVHAASPVSVDSSSTAIAQVVPTTTTSSVAETTSTSSTSTAAKATSTAESSSSAFTAGTKGITYSPYTSSGACKSLEEVKSDLSKLTDFSLIRLYGVDCNQVENVLQAKADGQKLFLGIYFMDAIEAGISQIAAAIDSYAGGSWDDIHTVSIGNELVNSGLATVDQVSSYVTTGRNALTAAGYTGSVVSVDTHVAIIANPGLCDISDYAAFNAHAFWDGSIYPEGAGAWLLLQMQRVWSACGGKKDTLCTESGWPHAGNTYGVAVPSTENLQTAISSIESTCGDSTIAFTAFDDLWKSPGAYDVEQYWGIYSS